MRTRARIVWLLGLAAAFGVTLALVKGQDAGARDAIGNTSAPWVLLPFLVGTRFGSAGRAALAGVAATCVAFAGFYVTEAFVLDLGPHPWYVDLRLAAGTINPYEKLGFLSGAAYGALGYLWAVKRSRIAALALGLAFVTEPLVVLALSRAGIWGGGELLGHPAIWVTELLVGCGLTVWLARRPARSSAQALKP